MWISAAHLPTYPQVNKVKIKSYLFSPDRGIDNGVHLIQRLSIDLTGYERFAWFSMTCNQREIPESQNNPRHSKRTAYRWAVNISAVDMVSTSSACLTRGETELALNWQGSGCSLGRHRRGHQCRRPTGWVELPRESGIVDAVVRKSSATPNNPVNRTPGKARRRFAVGFVAGAGYRMR
jgi:hypothetical protein